MFDVDSAVAAAITGSGTPVLRLSALNSDGTVRQSWSTNEGITIQAACDYDLTRAVRRGATISIANEDGSLAPQEPGDLFYVRERIRLESGFLIGRTPTYIQMFEGHIASFDASMAGTLNLTAWDPFQLLDQPFPAPVTVPDGMTAEDVVKTIAEPVLGDSTNWQLDGAGRVVTLRTWTIEDRRLAALVALMHDLGLEVFADRFGQVVLRPRPDPTTQVPVLTLQTPDPDAVLLGLTRSSADVPHNYFVVTSQRPDQSVIYGVSEFDDPASPLHKDRIGLSVAEVYRLDTGAADQTAVNDVARQYATEDALNLDSIDIDMVEDQRLDEGDVVYALEGRSGTDDRYRIRRVSHPLTESVMQVTADRVLPLFLTAEAA